MLAPHPDNFTTSMVCYFKSVIDKQGTMAFLMCSRCTRIKTDKSFQDGPPSTDQADQPAPFQMAAIKPPVVMTIIYY